MDIDAIRLTPGGAGAVNVDLPILGLSPTSPLILKGADGLGPPEITIHMPPSARAGSWYQNKTVAPRQVVLLVGLNPNYGAGQSVESLRTQLYGLLSSTIRSYDEILINLMKDGAPVAFTYSFVSKMELNPFSEKPEVQITFDCRNPYFESVTYNNVVPSSKGTFTVVNPGTAPASFNFSLTLTSVPTGTLTINHDGSGEKMQINGPFAVGDKITMITDPRSRMLSLTPSSGIPVTLLNRMASYSKFFLLKPGPNQITINHSGYDYGVNGFQFKSQYWGV